MLFADPKVIFICKQKERTEFRIVNLSHDVNVTAITQNHAKNGTS
jgi:hypothetical protein